MIDLTGVEHHLALTEMVDVLCNKTQNDDRSFFQVEAAYFISKMASSMRAVVVTRDRGEIPVNCYALALATSGFGKGHSISICEDEFMKSFKHRFMEDTMPALAEDNLWKVSNDRAARNGSGQQGEFDKADKEYKKLGTFPFTFDSGTSPAVKQLRDKLLLANVGSINLQIDEIGMNLVGNVDVLTVFLELYDQGRVKQKLIKNTVDNQRNEELDGKTPANMLLFGTPSKLLDGGATEDQFFSFLDTGYARRCLFAWGKPRKKNERTLTAVEIYDNLVRSANDTVIQKWNTHFNKLADRAQFNWKMSVEDDVGIKLVEYQLACEDAAEQLKDHEEIRKAEMNHRYFKALKLAGAYAFIDGSNEVEMDHLLSAILLVEESGAAFQAILTREKTYVKLARYIADVDTEQTHTDLMEALPFYKSGQRLQSELIAQATAWGYKRHIIIKKSFVDGIEFFKGETLDETDLEQVVLSYSNHWAYNYEPEKVPFKKLHDLTQAQGMHWSNHHFRLGHRAEENVLSGFNLVVIDVDGGISLQAAHELLKDYTFLTHTTKRHVADKNRFRLIMPSNYFLELDSVEYRDFMNSVMAWLPLKTDEGANQRARKWETFEGGSFHYNEGELLDVLPFIPKTSRNEEYLQENRKLESLDNLERWFAQRIASGNRNTQMIKYALALVDCGMALIEVGQQVHSFNKKLNTPMSQDEIESTILVTVAKRFQKKSTA